jgi:aspartate/methionine/tyrosine aminotransferase
MTIQLILFSHRTAWDRTSNRLSATLERKRARGVTILDLTESNPTRAGIPYPADLLAPLATAESLRYEPAPMGWRPAREAVAAEYVRYGTTVDPEHVLLTASTSEAYSLAFKLLCEPGDEVLVPAPSYPLFDFLAGLDSVAVKPYPLLMAGGEWPIDLDALASRIGARTRAIVVVNPNNPTGSFLKRDEAARLLGLAAEHDLAVLSDEVFLDYADGPDARRVGTLAAASDALTLSMGGLSKSCGLPQLKLGWMVVAGPAAVRDEALARLEIIADTYLSVGTPVQRAAPALLARGASVRDAIAVRVRDNRAVVAHAVRASHATLLPAEGGWYAILRVPATRNEEDLVVSLLEEKHVHVHPGFFFGLPQEAYLVVSLLCDRAVLEDGLARVLAVL